MDVAAVATTSLPMSIRSKACPRCGVGALFEERDVFGRYVFCVQCGWARELRAAATAERRLADEIAAARRKARRKRKKGDTNASASPSPTPGQARMQRY